MFDALLITIGALAMLVSIAAKFVQSSVDEDENVDRETGKDQSHDKVLVFPMVRSDRAQPRTGAQGRGARNAIERSTLDDVA